MRKLKYYGPDIRHKIVANSDKVETILQRRHCIFFWENIYGTNIHFELRSDPLPSATVEGQRIFPHINPSVMHFMNMGLGAGHLYGELETWDESTFDLERRLYEIANAYCKAIKITKQYSSLIEKQIDQL